MKILRAFKNMCGVRVVKAAEGLCQLSRGHDGPHRYWIYAKPKRKYTAHRKGGRE